MLRPNGIMNEKNKTKKQKNFKQQKKRVQN